MASYYQGSSDEVPGESNARRVPSEPALVSLEPSSARISDDPFSLHCHGYDFSADAVITWNGDDKATAHGVEDERELTTAIDPSLEVAGEIPVTVRNGVAGGESRPATFTILPAE